MVKTLVIQGLFGRFNYQIDIKNDILTIITGPNGFGKSTILYIINAVAEGNCIDLMRLEFDAISIEFDNKEIVNIKKGSNSLSIDDVRINFHRPQQKSLRVKYRQSQFREDDLDSLLHLTTNRLFTEDDKVHYSYFLDEELERLYKPSGRKKYQQFLEKLDQMKKYSGNVRFISEQRLIRREVNRRDEEIVIDVITELPKRLKDEIAKVTEEYSTVANKLDGSYPQRLFSEEVGLSDELEFQARLKDANDKFKKLNQYNLVDMFLIGQNQEYKSEYSTALKIYFDDFSEKYKVFEPLIRKLDLFTSIINERLHFKKLKISRQDGFQIVDEDDQEKTLELGKLSSGEKQEIVLFYELIFDTQSELLLLIDEPEISLHVAWQKQFINDLLEIAQQTSVKVIVATHSPQIISNHWDAQIDLGELYANKQFD